MSPAEFEVPSAFTICTGLSRGMVMKPAPSMIFSSIADEVAPESSRANILTVPGRFFWLTFPVMYSARSVLDTEGCVRESGIGRCESDSSLIISIPGLLKNLGRVPSDLLGRAETF